MYRLLLIVAAAVVFALPGVYSVATNAAATPATPAAADTPLARPGVARLNADGTVDEGFSRAARNIARIDVLPSVGANVYDILNHEILVITQAGVEGLKERLA